MKISIKGILISYLAALALGVCVLYPMSRIFAHARFILLFILIFGAALQIFQGFLLARIGGSENFPLSALLSAGFSSILALFSKGFIPAIVGFCLTLGLLWIGRLVAGKRESI